MAPKPAAGPSAPAKAPAVAAKPAAKPAAPAAKPAAPASKPAAAKPAAASSAPAKKPAAAGPSKAAAGPSKPAAKSKAKGKGKAAGSALAPMAHDELLAAAPEEPKMSEEEIARLEAERAELAARIQIEAARIQDKVERRRKRREDRNKAEKALLSSCFDDEADKVRAGIERGVRVECRDHEGNSPLSEASCAGADEVVRYLLSETPADVDTKNSKGRTPLFRAAFGGKASTVRLLLDAGADPSIASDSLESPIQVAATEEIKAAIQVWTAADAAQAKAKRTAELDAKGIVADGSKAGDSKRDALRELLYDTEEEEKAPAAASSGPRYVVEVGTRQLPDVLDKAALTGRCVLLVDPTGLGASYLSYRDTNYLSMASKRDMGLGPLRLALLGGLRYGKPAVIDAGDAKLEVEALRGRFDAVCPGLFEKVLDLSVTQLDDLQALLRHVLSPQAGGGGGGGGGEEPPAPLDPYEYAFEKYSERNLGEFRLILVTRRPDAPEGLKQRMFVVCTA